MYCPRSLTHSFSHFSLIYPPHRSQIPRFSQPIGKGFGNKSGLTFGVSSPRSGGDSRDTQLLTEATDETALIIIIVTTRETNLFMNKPHHHSLTRSQKVDVG